MSTSLQKFTAQRVESAPVPATIDDAMRVGEIMAMFDADGNKANAIAKVIAGQELGIGPMAAIRGINMIKGKPSLSAELVATLIKRSGRYDFRSKVGADQATVTIFDQGEALDPVTFTLADAKTAGLDTGNPNYKKFPGDMCFTKALIRAARRHCPEVIGGAVYLDDGETPPEPVVSIASAPREAEYVIVDGTAAETPAPSAEDIGRSRFAALRGSGLSDDAIVTTLREVGIESSAALADDAAWEVAQEAVRDAVNPPQTETLPGMEPQGEDPHS